LRATATPTLSALACRRFALWPGDICHARKVSDQVLVPAAIFSAAIPVFTADILEENDPATLWSMTPETAIALAWRSAIAVSWGSVLTVDRPCSRRYCEIISAIFSACAKVHVTDMTTATVTALIAVSSPSLPLKGTNLSAPDAADMRHASGGTQTY